MLITSTLKEIYVLNRFNTLNTSKSKKRCITSKYGALFSIKWNLNDQNTNSCIMVSFDYAEKIRRYFL